MLLQPLQCYAHNGRNDSGFRLLKYTYCHIRCIEAWSTAGRDCLASNTSHPSPGCTRSHSHKEQPFLAMSFVVFTSSEIIHAESCLHLGTLLLLPDTHTQTNRAVAMPNAHYCHICCHGTTIILHIFITAKAATRIACGLPMFSSVYLSHGDHTSHSPCSKSVHHSRIALLPK